VIQQTIREQLPEGFQKAEYLLAHGMIDMVVHRHQLRDTLSRVCRLLTGSRRVGYTARTLAERDAEHGYLNGSLVDGDTIATLARSYGDVMEPDPAEEAERYEARETTRDPDKARPKPGARA
jgi:acetyl-CoA carboxylase carboxyl transferase subunit beta